MIKANKNYWFLFFLSAICLLGYAGYKYWKPLAIAPKHIVDGYVDYTLVDDLAPQSGILEADFHREEWLLRFAEETLIEVSERRVGAEKVLTNKWIKFYLNLSSLSILSKPDLTQKDDVVAVTVDAKKINYGLYDEKNKFPHKAQSGFLAFFQFSEFCLDGDEVYPGIFLLREANAEEKQQILENGNTDSQHCISETSSNVPFRYYDISGRPKAYGNCVLPLGEIDKILSKDTHCRWAVWINQRRRLYLNLPFGQFYFLPDIIMKSEEMVNKSSIRIYGER